MCCHGARGKTRSEEGDLQGVALVVCPRWTRPRFLLKTAKSCFGGIVDAVDDEDDDDAGEEGEDEDGVDKGGAPGKEGTEVSEPWGSLATGHLFGSFDGVVLRVGRL